MNEFLKFSWSHIFTFLAVILLGYFSFLGASYWTDGNFLIAGVITAVIVLVLIFWFVTPQMLKGTSGRFMKLKKSIQLERVFIFTCPLIFVLSLGPLVHFWNVHSHNDEIVKTFKDGINASTGIFKHYDNYANARIVQFDTCLQQAENATGDSLFNGRSGKAVQHAVMKQALTDKLLAGNYNKLSNEATRWIQEANQDPSTWNVFLMGNVDEIKKSIIKWRDQLVELSTPVFKAEQGRGAQTVKLYDDDKGIINNAVATLEKLDTYYSSMEAPKPVAIGLSILIFFLLLFPYLLQRRHSKSTYKLIGKRKSLGGMSLAPDVNTASTPGSSDNAGAQDSNNNDNDFGVFKL